MGKTYQTRPKKTGEIRIISGQWKRTKLPVADIEGLKPTPDRVRETLFNWLGQNLQGVRCLDVFAGSGALGFEAASRGAQEVLLLEKSKLACGHLHKVQKQLKADQVRILCTDGIHYLQSEDAEVWDVIFLDPPFGLDVFEEVLDLACRKMSSSGVIYLESDRIIPVPPGLSIFREARAGSVYYTLLRAAESSI